MLNMNSYQRKQYIVSTKHLSKDALNSSNIMNSTINTTNTNTFDMNKTNKMNNIDTTNNNSAVMSISAQIGTFIFLTLIPFI